VAGRLAKAIPNAIWANQFDNIANRQSHIDSTGPEIWHQTGGKVSAFVCSTGTGGTLGGVSRALKSFNANVKTYLADPRGSPLYHGSTPVSWKPPVRIQSPKASASVALANSKVRCWMARAVNIDSDHGVSPVARRRPVPR
jgi:cysteine synthase